MTRDTATKKNPVSLVPQLFERHGPLSAELTLEPARFGLGLLPNQMQPDQVASSVCGFCSTGCNLNIHLQDDAAVGLTPAKNYPVNLGMACPKGWEALAVLDSPDRATRRCCETPPASSNRSTGTRPWARSSAE